MTGLYLQTPSCVISLSPGYSYTQAELASRVMHLLAAEDWVRLAGNFTGVLGTWTVLERDERGDPALVSFERPDGLMELCDPHVEM